MVYSEIHMPPLSDISVEDKDRVLDVIQHAHAINRHVDFFTWLQQEIRHFLPHDVLVATWGNFSTGALSYDIVSSIPGIRTQKIIEGMSLEPLISTLYYRWMTNEQQWYELEDFGLFMADSKQGFAASALGPFAEMMSVAVHGIHDKRSKDDCLYVFFSRAPSLKMNSALLRLLLPHIDAALRRIESLPRVDGNAIASTSFFGLSEREDEILNWVCLGKTNEEIGLILEISPNTVKNHLKKVFQKLFVSTRAQAAAKYKQAVDSR